MAETSEQKPGLNRVPQFLKRQSVPITIFVLAAGLIFLTSESWIDWTAGRAEQTTEDAYLRADVTPLSTKAAGLVAAVAVSDYEAVKAGDLLVQLRDEDFQAQTQQAEAASSGGEGALVSNLRQTELQEARITQAEVQIQAAEAEIAAAEAGIVAANSAIVNTQSAAAASQADMERTLLERKRQEVLVGQESSTRQKLEQATADELRFRAQFAGRQAEMNSAQAQLTSRQADLERAKAHREGARAEVEAQKRQRAVLQSQVRVLQADLSAKRAGLNLSRTNLSYTRIVAPADGFVGERKVRVGQLASPGTQVISLVQRNIWVQANQRDLTCKDAGRRPGSDSRRRFS